MGCCYLCTIYKFVYANNVVWCALVCVYIIQKYALNTVGRCVHIYKVLIVAAHKHTQHSYIKMTASSSYRYVKFVYVWMYVFYVCMSILLFFWSLFLPFCIFLVGSSDNKSKANKRKKKNTSIHICIYSGYRSYYKPTRIRTHRCIYKYSSRTTTSTSNTGNERRRTNIQIPYSQFKILKYKRKVSKKKHIFKTIHPTK